MNSPAPISSRPFGRLPDGRGVDAWTLRNDAGLEVEILNYGGIITRILAPDREGRRSDLVLGFERLEDYLGEHPYFGAVVGRVAGRITRGTFTWAGTRYQLDCNDPPNHLHGGPGSIDRKLWEAAACEGPDKAPSLELSCRSRHGENGYPGEVAIRVRYTLTPGNEIHFETEVTSDRPTPVSLTQHSYFHLGGEGSGTIADHELQIESDSVFDVDADMTLLDSRSGVTAGPADFRTPRRLRDAIPHLWKQHGDLYWLGEATSPRPVATLHDPESGRILRVATTLPCLQLYTGVSLDGTLTGRSGNPYLPFSGLCLECEGYPGAIGPGPFGNILVTPDTPQKTLTIYSFSTDSTLSGQ